MSLLQMMTLSYMLLSNCMTPIGSLSNTLKNGKNETIGPRHGKNAKHILKDATLQENDIIMQRAPKKRK